MIAAGHAPVFIFMASQVSGPVIQILTVAGTTGLMTAVLQFVLNIRGQNQTTKEAVEERTERYRKRVQELEDSANTREDALMDMRRQLRSSEVLIEAQASTISLDARKMSNMEEDIKYLRRRIRVLEGTQDGNGE